MKTKKQVMDEFFRLQKKYADIKGFADIEVYNNGEGTYWTVQLRLTHFTSRKIDWVESVVWDHYSDQSEANEASNESAVAKFIKKMEERLK